MSPAPTSSQRPDGSTRSNSARLRKRPIGWSLLLPLLGFVLAAFAVSAGWWGWVRLTAPGRRLSIERPETAEVSKEASARDTVRILTWNIAHGRGARPQGILENWEGGSQEERLQRLESIAEMLRRANADIVVLNEVDFDSQWSHGVDQAAFLAGAAGYPTRVEQRNFDFGIPFAGWAFGNAVLSRLPLIAARWIELPPHSRLEEALVGSKESATVELETAGGPLSVVPVHLEFRDEETRLRAVPVFESLRSEERAPLLLVGDFNTAPPGWPGVGNRTAVGELLGEGFASARAAAGPSSRQLTFPTYAPQESRDWVLATARLRILRSDVVQGAGDLSDHAPVLAVLELPTPRRED